MTANVSPATPSAPIIVKHSGCPEWGLGYLSEERDEKRFYDFEDGMSHSIAKDFWSKLEPVSLGAAEARALEKKVRTLREQRPAPGKPKQRAVAPVLPNFEVQVARFDELYPGGFGGDRYVKEERGDEAETTGKKGKGGRAIAIATAKKLLAREELDRLIGEGKYAEVVASVRAVQKAAGALLHPLGDLIPFSKMPATEDQAFAEATRDLLYGEGAFEARFDKLVAVLAKSSLATWPLATVLPALVFPDQHVFVKPSFYEKQAVLIGFDLRYERVPSSAAYGRMRALVDELVKRLSALGKSPRDKMDVYTFFWKTLTPQKKA
jgi:hypothetical protein